ncbi:hypothetical protein AMECASPLE_033284 [Ameca splendens]|uniref:Uncharacterized protein n=1 Tax=Ameca splendens TaxID=208324 RepID=A0ABV0ZI34_9TELE
MREEEEGAEEELGVASPPSTSFSQVWAFQPRSSSLFARTFSFQQLRRKLPVLSDRNGSRRLHQIHQTPAVFLQFRLLGLDSITRTLWSLEPWIKLH